MKVEMNIDFIFAKRLRRLAKLADDDEKQLLLAQADLLERYARGDESVEECGCVLPGQSCSLCEATAAAVYGFRRIGDQNV